MSYSISTCLIEMLMDTFHVTESTAHIIVNIAVFLMCLYIAYGICDIIACCNESEHPSRYDMPIILAVVFALIVIVMLVYVFILG